MNHTRLIIAAIVNRGALSDEQRKAIFAKQGQRGSGDQPKTMMGRAAKSLSDLSRKLTGKDIGYTAENFDALGSVGTDAVGMVGGPAGAVDDLVSFATKSKMPQKVIDALKHAPDTPAAEFGIASTKTIAQTIKNIITEAAHYAKQKAAAAAGQRPPRPGQTIELYNRGPISEAQRRAIFAKKRNPQPAAAGPRIGPGGSLVMPATPPPAAGSGTVQAGSVAAPTGGLSKTPPPGRYYPANMPPAGMQWAYDAQGNRVAVPINYNFGSGKPITPTRTFPGRPSAPTALIEWFNATKRG